MTEVTVRLSMLSPAEMLEDELRNRGEKDYVLVGACPLNPNDFSSRVADVATIEWMVSHMEGDDDAWC